MDQILPNSFITPINQVTLIDLEEFLLYNLKINIQATEATFYLYFSDLYRLGKPLFGKGS